MRRLLAGILGVGLGALGPEATGQIELDRIVSRVDGRVLTQSDVRRVRALHLVESIDSDGAALRALENRLLTLRELDRAAPLDPPDPDALGARRDEWVSTHGSEERATTALRQAGMSEDDLSAWFRDDLRIRAYVRRQFGMLSDLERVRAVDDWLRRLRQRADLPP